MTEPNYARLFHEATAKEGDVWHEVVSVTPKPRCSCGKMFMWQSDLFKHIDESNPTYDNPRDIFKRMKDFCGEERFFDFIKYAVLGYEKCKYYTTSIGCVVAFIENYCFNPPALLKKAVEFLKGEG